jgi:nucleotide-binding universal stress UspA family protein
MRKIKNILCPVDFFPASIAAANYAARLAARNKARLYLLHVMSPVVIPDRYEYPLPYMPQLMKSIRQASAQQMEKIESRLKRTGIIVSSRLRLGDVYDQIEREIKSLKPDLAVMGTHGRHGLKRWLLGSTTEKLVRHSPVPLLILSSERDRSLIPHFRRIVLATDLSEGTTDALAFALLLVQKDESKITLLHVVDDLAADVSGEYRGALLSGVQQQLEEFVPPRSRNRCDIVTKVDVGRPDRIIRWTLRSNKADLVVISIHGKSIMDRVLLRSTAEHVVRSARCPVLLIPPMKKSTRARKAGTTRPKTTA